MDKSMKIPMNLQLFAELGGDPTGGDPGSGASGNQQNTNNQQAGQSLPYLIFWNGLMSRWLRVSPDRRDAWKNRRVGTETHGERLSGTY